MPNKTVKIKPDYEKITDLIYSGGACAKNTHTESSHKTEILATRKGGFGSSDAARIAYIAKVGKVLPTHYKRLAVFEGIIEPDDFPPLKQ